MFNNVVNKETTNEWIYSMGGRVNVSDKIVQTPTFSEVVIEGTTYYFLSFPYFLFKLESQLTKKTKIFSRGSTIPSIGTNVNTFNRYVTLTWKYNTPSDAVEDLSVGKVIVGSDDFPLGFYNLTIYEMETNDDVDPSNAKSTVYNGLLNMYPNNLNYGTNDSNFQEVNYKEYTTNDTDNVSTYLTN